MGDERRIRTLLLYQIYQPEIEEFYRSHIRRHQGADRRSQGV